MQIEARITTQPLIAPMNDMSRLYLTIGSLDEHEGASFYNTLYQAPATARNVEHAIAYVHEQKGIDVRPIILAEIDRRVRDTHTYAVRVPDELRALVAPVAIVAE